MVLFPGYDPTLNPRAQPKGKSWGDDVRGTQAGASGDCQNALKSCVESEEVVNLKTEYREVGAQPLRLAFPGSPLRERAKREKVRRGHWDKRRNLIKADDGWPQSP